MKTSDESGKLTISSLAAASLAACFGGKFHAVGVFVREVDDPSGATPKNEKQRRVRTHVKLGKREERRGWPLRQVSIRRRVMTPEGSDQAPGSLF